MPTEPAHVGRPLARLERRAAARYAPPRRRAAQPQSTTARAGSGGVRRPQAGATQRAVAVERLDTRRRGRRRVRQNTAWRMPLARTSDRSTAGIVDDRHDADAATRRSGSVSSTGRRPQRARGGGARDNRHGAAAGADDHVGNPHHAAVPARRHRPRAASGTATTATGPRRENTTPPAAAAGRASGGGEQCERSYVTWSVAARARVDPYFRVQPARASSPTRSGSRATGAAQPTAAPRRGAARRRTSLGGNPDGDQGATSAASIGAAVLDGAGGGASEGRRDSRRAVGEEG